MIIENTEKLKEIRRDLRLKGYRLKTHFNSLGRFGEVFSLTEDKEEVYLSDIHSKEHYNKHMIMFDYFEDYRNNLGVIIIK